MVRCPNFKLLAKGKDITEKVRANLISINFDDKEGGESDEIRVSVFGLFSKPDFGDSLELWLGEGERLYKCGSFALNSLSRDYKQKRTEFNATAVDFSSLIKEKKSRSFENTSLFSIAKTISSENALALKTSGSDTLITSVLQHNENSLEFLHKLCFNNNFLCVIKEKKLILSEKESKSEVRNLNSKNEELPRYELSLEECFSLEISESQRNDYDSVFLSWQDSDEGKIKSLKVGNGDKTYKMQIAQPKNQSEAYKLGEAKLNALQKGSLSGRLETDGRNIRAGGKLKIKGIKLDEIEFSIKTVSHSLSNTGYTLSVEFEG